MDNQKHPLRDFLIIFGIVVSVITTLVTAQGDTVISLGYCNPGATVCILGKSFLLIIISSLVISLVALLIVKLGSQMIKVRKVEFQQANTIKKVAVLMCRPTDRPHDGKPYISVEITSQENGLLKCYCFVRRIRIDSITRDDIKSEVFEHTNRISWSGGHTEGDGIRHIDSMGFAKLNIASLNSKNPIGFLMFETAKGSKGGHLPFGIYSVDLELGGTLDDERFQEISLNINFEYREEVDSFEDEQITDGKAITRRLFLSTSADRGTKNTLDWGNVAILPWNPSLSEHAKCGIEIVNNKSVSVNNCYVELISVYEEMDGQFVLHQTTPCNLPWIINNKQNYEKIEIEPTKHKYLGLTFPTFGVNDLQFYGVVGQGFNYAWPNSGRLSVEFEVSGKIGLQTINPEKLFATILRQGNRFTVVSLSDKPPENIVK